MTKTELVLTILSIAIAIVIVFMIVGFPQVGAHYNYPKVDNTPCASPTVEPSATPLDIPMASPSATPQPTVEPSSVPTGNGGSGVSDNLGCSVNDCSNNQIGGSNVVTAQLPSGPPNTGRAK